MAHDIAYYDRLHENHPDKTYNFLDNSLCRHVVMGQLEHKRRAHNNMRDHLTKGTPLIDRAAPVEGAQNTRAEIKKDNGKGQSQGRGHT